MQFVRILVLLLLAGATVAPACGAVIYVGDDAVLDRLVPDVAFGGGISQNLTGKAIQNDNTTTEKIPLFEFTLGSSPATSVTMNVYCQEFGKQTGTNLPTMGGWIYATEMGFDETAVTWTNTIGSQTADGYGYFSTWEEISPVSLTLGQTDNMLPCTLKELADSTGWQEFDVTAWYNANLGKTMSIAFQAISVKQARWRAEEWNEVNSVPEEEFGAFLNVIPEPSCMALLGLGGLFLRRRR